jgi:hypothetical protein
MCAAGCQRRPMLSVAGISGFLIALFEDAATAIAAGVVVGTFGSAMAGFVNEWTRRQFERDALRDGYAVAFFVFCGWILDLCNV